MNAKLRYVPGYVFSSLSNLRNLAWISAGSSAALAGAAAFFLSSPLVSVFSFSVASLASVFPSAESSPFTSFSETSPFSGFATAALASASSSSRAKAASKTAGSVLGRLSEPLETSWLGFLVLRFAAELLVRETDCGRLLEEGEAVLLRCSARVFWRACSSAIDLSRALLNRYSTAWVSYHRLSWGR